VKRQIIGGLLLGLGSALLALLFLETGIRVVTGFDRNYLDEIVNAPPLDESRRLNLAHLVRPDADARVVYTLRPNLMGQFLHRSISTNSLGIRGPERPLDKPDGTFRIFGLGDSHMFGWGVAQDEGFLPVLERMLNNDPGRLRFEAWNFAVPGYNTVQEARILERWKDQVEPDLILISYVDNDMHLPGFLRRRPNLWTLHRSYLKELIRRRWALLLGRRLNPLDLRVLGGSEQRPRDAEEIPDEFRPLYGWANLEAAYLHISAIARERKIPVVLLFTGQDSPQKPAIVRLREIADEQEFLVVDPWEYIRAQMRERGIRPSQLAVSKNDPHANATMHRIVAEELYRVITEADLFPSGRENG
jgi:lysophospholipase L1-like esterase